MSFSTNPGTQVSYPIPDRIDDVENIEAFLSRHEGKKVICVQGLGFVGAVMSLVCANALKDEYAVIGVDLASEESFWKIISLNEGVFPLVADDPKIDVFFEISKRKNNFYATCDERAYAYADIIIVDINLDVKKYSSDSAQLMDFDVDISGLQKAVSSLGRNCRDDVLIVVETTVPPGTCMKVVKPTIEAEFSKRGHSLTKYALGHSYERVMPGPKYIDSIREYPRVYSGSTDRCAERVEDFLGTIIDLEKCSLTRLDSTSASEMAKVLENSYRAMNISFVVEWSRFAEEAEVDLYEIVGAIRERESHANLMYPGIGVGGYCLTKDPLLASWARKNFFHATSGLEMSEWSVSVNDQMPNFAIDRLISITGRLEQKSVLVLGVAYRGDVGDTRFSPTERLVQNLEQAGVNVYLHDPYVSYWTERNCEVKTDLGGFRNESFEIIIIATKHSLYESDHLTESLKRLPPAFIFDAVGALCDKQIEDLSKIHKVSILGNGNIIQNRKGSKN